MATNKRRIVRPIYRARDFSEEDLITEFSQQLDDAKGYFLSYIRPRLDRSYKLYIAYTGDRQREIQRWQSNIFVPYTQAVVETLKPRILDARPDFNIQGRNQDDEIKAQKLQKLADYFWEKAEMDKIAELIVSSAMIYGSAFLQVYWKKIVKEYEFLKTHDIGKQPTWKKEKKVFYDAPSAEWVDNYSLWYDWRHADRKDKQFWFKRLLLTEGQIKTRYPMADPVKMGMIRPGGDMTDFAHIRREVKTTHESISRFRGTAAAGAISTSLFGGDLRYDNYSSEDLYEVFEWWRPMEDKYAVIVNGIPILKGGVIPNPYDFKETVFIDVPYMKVPGEFEGYGLPLILESPQIMLNTIKNQRIDATTLNIHKMWIVNPLANIDKKELVTRPFGIIYSTDPGGVREVQFSDVKSSAFQEENLLKNDMRYASGVDDFSMGAGTGATSATEVRHLRESTMERVRMFINHLGDAFATVQRYWMSMTKQFFTEDMSIRVIGENGAVEYPLIEKDDLTGEFDFKATVLPSIAGQNEIKKKQDMDLLQLLMNLPFVDQQKLVAKVLYDWQWDINNIIRAPEPNAQISGQGNPGEAGVESGAMPGGQEDLMANLTRPGGPYNEVPPEVAQRVAQLLGHTSVATGNPFTEAAMPIPLNPNELPPTVQGIPSDQAGNPRGLNRKPGGRVNTNIPTGNRNSNPEAALLTRTFNIQS